MVQSNQPDSRFQFHLITALIAMVAGSVMVGLNVVTLMRRDLDSGMLLETKGWPFVWWWRGPDLFGGHGRMMEEVFYWNLAMDVLVSLAIVLAAVVLFEFLRRATAFGRKVVSS